MRTTLLNLFGLALGAALCVGGALYAVEEVERRSVDGVADELAGENMDWVVVTSDGLQVHLAGTAPDEAARFHALSVASRVVDGSRVIDGIDVMPVETGAAPRFTLELLRHGDGLSLIGLVPADTDRDALRQRVRDMSGTAKVADLLDVADEPPPRSWDRALAFGIDALSALPRSKISITADRVSVTALADSLEEKRRIEASLARAAPTGVALALDIAAPRPVVTPFTLRFLIADGGARFDACSAATEEGRTAILRAAVAAGLKGKVTCTLGLGVPSPRWAEAAVAGIEALGRLGSGSVTLSDADVSLIAAADADPALFEEVAGDLDAALPDVFSLHAVAPEPQAEEATAPTEASVFTATRSEDGVRLRGRLATPRMRASVESFAQARFGVPQVQMATLLDESVPEGWSLRVLTALDALGYLTEGRAVVGPDQILVRGVSGDERASDEIARLMAETLGTTADVEIDVSYREELDPKSALPTPEECITRIRAAAAEQKITFAPGEETIEPSARGTIDRIAEILRECGPLPIEIAGYTDSQGREVMNLALSEARAESVLTALMSRRVLTSGMVATGYGEADPIADNANEAGREANRRIEFRLIEEPAAEDVASEVADEAAAADEAAPDDADADRTEADGAAAADEAAPGDADEETPEADADEETPEADE